VSRSDHRIGSKKAGLSGLFRACVIALLLGFSAPVMAEPISIEVANAEPAFDLRTNMPIVTFRMTEASGRLFAEFTVKNVGRKVDIRIDGKTVTSPVIREPLLQGTGQISNDAWTAAYTRDLANRLSTGKSKMEIEVANE
jgi:preprotein translocase subunit SecD